VRRITRRWKSKAVAGADGKAGSGGLVEMLLAEKSAAKEAPRQIAA